MPDDVFSVEKPVPDNVEALLNGMLNDFLGAEEELDRLKKQEEAITDKRNNVRQEIIKAMKDHGLVSQKFENGVMVVRATKKYPSVPGELRQKFHSWLKRHGYWKLARVPAQQEAALLKERLENDQKVPEYVRIFEEDTLQVRGRKKGD